MHSTERKAKCFWHEKRSGCWDGA